MSKSTFFEQLNPRGYLEVSKVFSDGRREIVFSDPNIIVKGMRHTLSQLFGAEESTPAENYKMLYFQLGVGGDANLVVSSTDSLGTPLVSNEYGAASPLGVVSHNLWHNGSLTQQSFVEINQAFITRTSSDSVSFLFDVDVNTANGMDINEVGLCSKNPFNFGVEASVLCAYRYFPAISKSNNFALSFKWTIEF